MLQETAEGWSGVLGNDMRLQYWINALGQPADAINILESEFADLPDYLINRVARNDTLIKTMNSDSEVWTNHQGDVLFSVSAVDNGSDFSLTLPSTKNGYLPCLSCSYRSSGNRFSVSASGSYNRSDSPAVSSSGEGVDPDDHMLNSAPYSLFCFDLMMIDWPVSLLADASFSGSLSTGGILYPAIDISVKGTVSENGDISMIFSGPLQENPAPVEALTITGSIIPVAPSNIPVFSEKELTGHLAVFAINDKTMSEFTQKVRRSFVMGLLDFLNEVPASSCKSIMDDLEDYGILDMLLDE